MTSLFPPLDRSRVVDHYKIIDFGSSLTVLTLSFEWGGCSSGPNVSCELTPCSQLKSWRNLQVRYIYWGGDVVRYYNEFLSWIFRTSNEPNQEVALSDHSNTNGLHPCEPSYCLTLPLNQHFKCSFIIVQGQIYWKCVAIHADADVMLSSTHTIGSNWTW